MQFTQLLRIAGLILAGTVLPLACTHAETINCTPLTSLPTTINASGIYCLTGDLTTGMTTGTAITINANNVTLDLNGYKLGGQAAGIATQTIGISSLNRKNITLTNGTIRGFYLGVSLHDDSSDYSISGGHLVENLRAEGNTLSGITVRGRGNIIRNNQVINTGGCPIFDTVYGIIAAGVGSRVLNNDVSGTVASRSGISYGIDVSSAGNIVDNNRVTDTTSAGGSIMAISVESDAGTVRNNIISNLALSAQSYGIHTHGNNLNLRDNNITNMSNGIVVTGSGTYMGNLVSGAATAYSGGTAGPGNSP